MSPPTNRRSRRTRGRLFPTYMPVDQPNKWFLVDAWGTLLRQPSGSFVTFTSEEEAEDHATALAARLDAPGQKEAPSDDGTP